MHGETCYPVYQDFAHNALGQCGESLGNGVWACPGVWGRREAQAILVWADVLVYKKMRLPFFSAAEF